jgi:hypothetical protein
LNLTLPLVQHATKESNHGYEEKEEDEIQQEVEVMTPALASYWGRAVDFGFREAPAWCFAKRPNR